MTPWTAPGLSPEERAAAVDDDLAFGSGRVDTITAAIRAAVEQERERCARVADAEREAHPFGQYAHGYNHAAATIARAIRTPAAEGGSNG